MKNKDSQKSTDISQNKKNKKHRGFLKPLGFALTAVLATSPLINRVTPNANISSLDNRSEETSITRIYEQNNPLIIHPSNTTSNSGVVAEHSSHYSHESHSSHVSHVSHYSSS